MFKQYELKKKVSHTYSKYLDVPKNGCSFLGVKSCTRVFGETNLFFSWVDDFTDFVLSSTKLADIAGVVLICSYFVKTVKHERCVERAFHHDCCYCYRAQQPCNTYAGGMSLAFVCYVFFK